MYHDLSRMDRSEQARPSRVCCLRFAEDPVSRGISRSLAWGYMRRLQPSPWQHRTISDTTMPNLTDVATIYVETVRTGIGLQALRRQPRQLS
jgi:hypothetical protein